MAYIPSIIASGTINAGTIGASVTSGTYSQVASTTVTVTAAGHGLTSAVNGHPIYLTITSGTATSGFYQNFTFVDANNFTVTASASATASGNVTLDGVSVERTLLSVTIPGNSLGSNGRLEFRCNVNVINSANNKTLRAKYGGTTFVSPTGASILIASCVFGFQNQGATNSQIATLASGGYAPTSGTNAFSTMSIDSTADQTLLLTAQPAAVNEYVHLVSYQVIVYPSA